MDISKNLKTMAAEVAEALGTPKGKTYEALAEMFEGLVQATEKGKVTIHGIGSFSQKVTKEKTGRNPKTGEPIKVPAKSVLVFKCAARQRKEIVLKGGKKK